MAVWDVHRGRSPATADRPFLLRNRRDRHDPLVDGAPREPLIGVLLGTGSAQVDGVVNGAFRRRASFRRRAPGDCRVVDRRGAMAIVGDAGVRPGQRPVHRLSRRGAPAARRPARRTMPKTGPSPEALRALVHELRTPTNAISGFCSR